MPLASVRQVVCSSASVIKYSLGGIGGPDDELLELEELLDDGGGLLELDELLGGGGLLELLELGVPPPLELEELSLSVENWPRMPKLIIMLLPPRLRSYKSGPARRADRTYCW